MSTWKWKALMLSPILISATITSIARADGWSVLEGVAYTETGENEAWRVEKTFPDGYEAGDETFRITGYPVIFEAQTDLTDILLVPDPESCPFCGNGEGYGPTLSVTFARPIDIPRPDLPITVEGRLDAIHDPQTYEAFRLMGARLETSDG